jgi:hypothetical protein
MIFSGKTPEFAIIKPTKRSHLLANGNDLRNISRPFDNS